MDLRKILAISGKPGLYELKVQTRSGFLVESLIDGKKSTIGLRSNVSLLSEISIYTNSGEESLTKIMQAISAKENNGPAPSHKEDIEVLTKYFADILPDYDKDRVYPSDIKKVMNWYNLLQSKGLTDSMSNSEETPNSEEVSAE